MAITRIDQISGPVTLIVPTVGTGRGGDLLAANNLSDVADASTSRTNLGVAIGTDVQAYSVELDTYVANPLTAAELGELQNIDSTTISAAQWGYLGGASAFGGSLIDDADAAAARTTLGLAIGTDVQAFDAGLQSISGLTTSADQGIYTTGADTYATFSLTSAGRALLDDADAAAQRTTLGVPGLATNNTFTGDNNFQGALLKDGNAVYQPNRMLNVIDDFGAIADARELAQASMTSGSPTLTRNGHLLTSADVGKTISVTGAGAGGVELSSTIIAVSDANTITLANNAATTVSGARFIYGTDNATAFQSALDGGQYVRVPAGLYCIGSQITFSDGSKLVGDGAFFRPRSAYDYNSHNATVLIWTGAPGANTCPVRVSATAVGVEGADFGGESTDDLLDIRFEDIHIDARGADFGVYFYRCGSNSYVNNITSEDAKVAGLVGWGLFSIRWGFLGAHENRGKGAIFGADYTPVTSGWSNSEKSCFGCVADVYMTTNGTGETFVENSGTDEDGAGGLFRFGRGSRIRVQSEGNDGRAFVIEGKEFDAPVFYEMVYIEANGAGPKVNYTNNTKGIRLVNAFVHPGNGSTLVPETIKIAADSADGGPSDYSDWLILENLYGPGVTDSFDVNSNTYKYRVINSAQDITFEDQLPSANDESRDTGDAIINGQFAVWQRGTSISADGYGPDRWRISLSGATGSLSRQALTPGELPGLDAPEPKYFARLATTVADDNTGLLQYIPDARAYAGQRIFLSFWAKGATGGGTSLGIRIDWTQNFGTGGSPSSASTKVVGNITIPHNGVWRRYVLPFDVDSVNGQTFGTNDDSYVQLRLRNVANQTFTFDIACVQIDVGGYGAKSYRMRSYTEELARCLPFFQRLCSGTLFRPIAGAGQCFATTGASFSLGFPAPMRKAPTLIVSSVGHFSLTGDTGGDIVITGLTLNASRTNQLGGELEATVASGLSAGDATNIRATNSAAILDLDAEL